MREHGIPFKTAHAIAGRLLKSHRENPDAALGPILGAVSGDLLGAPLQYSEAQIAQIMSPRHFVEVRRTYGGPAPEETARAIQASLELFDRDQAWVGGIREGLASADARLRDRSQAL